MLKEQFIDPLLELVFPPVCIACGKLLMQNEDLLCAECMLDLPRTNYHLHPENPVAENLWGRARVENATAFYIYEKGSRFRKLVHDIKYRKHKTTAVKLGRMFGAELKDSAFSKADLVIPVPLHPRKKRIRGFNQSEYIARGISEVMGLELNTSSLYRKLANPTQTTRDRLSRWENVGSVFALRDTAVLEGKHILLVDDVLTTGATIDACANTLLKIDGLKLSVAVLAMAF